MPWMVSKDKIAMVFKRLEDEFAPSVLAEKMGFVDHDLRKLPELKMDRYMTIIYDTEDGPC